MKMFFVLLMTLALSNNIATANEICGTSVETTEGPVAGVMSALKVPPKRIVPLTPRKCFRRYCGRVSDSALTILQMW